MYICRKLRLYVYLTQRGFKYEYEKEDKKNSNYKIWIYKETPELRLAIEEYYSSDYFKNNKKNLK